MKAFSKEQSLSWCQERGVIFSSESTLRLSEYRSCISVELPEKPFQVVALANALIGGDTTFPFRGALLWIRQWGVWSESVERVGFRIMQAIRSLHGDETRFEIAPGYLFESELVDLHVCLVQPMLIGWDAFLVPHSGEYLIATSHDETTCILSRSLQTHERWLAGLQRWKPKEEPESYVKGIMAP